MTVSLLMIVIAPALAGADINMKLRNTIGSHISEVTVTSSHP